MSNELSSNNPDLQQQTRTLLRLAVLTVSDRHNLETDDTGAAVCRALTDEGHQLMHRAIVADNRYQIRAVVSTLIADHQCQVIVLCGGTGLSTKNSTIAAISPLFDREIPGFGELFRHLSFLQIGSAAMQSAATAGLANHTLICAMPGSRGAAMLACQQLLIPQLRADTKPCNFNSLLQTHTKRSC